MPNQPFRLRSRCSSGITGASSGSIAPPAARPLRDAGPISRGPPRGQYQPSCRSASCPCIARIPQTAGGAWFRRDGGADREDD